jgi:hypothetical protein
MLCHASESPTTLTVSDCLCLTEGRRSADKAEDERGDHDHGDKDEHDALELHAPACSLAFLLCFLLLCHGFYSEGDDITVGVVRPESMDPEVGRF